MFLMQDMKYLFCGCRWFCHFDDDIYVNVPMLVSTLSKYNPLKDKVYIGRWPREVDKLSRPEELFRNTFLHYVCAF